MNKLYIHLSVLILVFLISSCGETKSKKIENKINDSIFINSQNNTIVNAGMVEKKHTIYHLGTENVDSIVGGYHISFKIQDDKQSIVNYPIIDSKDKKDTSYYANQEVILTISRDGKSILSNRKIKKTDFSSFIPKSEISKYCISSFNIIEVSSNGIKFSINICKPDTDICYFFELTITNMGTIRIKEIIERESDM